MRKQFLLLALLFMSFGSFTQGFQVNFQGQKQQAMGSAGIGLVQDAATVFFNPAGITKLQSNEVNVAVSPVFSSVLFEENDSEAIGRTNSPVGTPFSMYAAWKKNKESKWGFGMGVYTPFGSTISWEDGWIGRFAMLRLQLKAIYFQPTISYAVNEQLSFGAGLIYATGNVSLKKNIPVQDSNLIEGLAELNGKASGFGYNLGILYKIHPLWSIGLNYRSQINVVVDDGQATFTVPTSLDANFPDGTFSSSLPLPMVASIGIGYNPNEKWQAAFDINWVGWKAYDTLAFDYEVNTASLTDTRSARMYKNTLAFRTGVSYKANHFLVIRGGLAYGISPVPNGYLTPETPDANRLNYTAGCSLYLGEHFECDLSILYAQIKRTDTNIETGLSGTFRAKAIAPGMAMIYRF
jgi:long-chain fatty acid transport protein